MQERRKICILGSTGSIGTQALEVICNLQHLFEPVAIAAGKNIALLAEQCHKVKPKYAVIADESLYLQLKDLCKGLPTEIMAGRDAINFIAALPENDLVLAAMVGYAGLEPAIHAIKAGKDIALANKESLVVAGEIVTELCRQNSCKLLPVDSEHSAIFQCLQGNYQNQIEKLILTASGGPFRTYTAEMLQNIRKEDALKHPKWKMGAKITIDSATMMNKGFEVIEARWLFNVPYNKIDVLVHPQSIVHSMVQFTDGAVMAQMGVPDMKLPIQYAFCYPNRVQNPYPRLDLTTVGQLEFEKPDRNKFKCLDLAYTALEKGGNYPCVLNAANEVAVSAFLNDQISFTEIGDIIETTLHKTSYINKPTYQDYVESDKEARSIALQFTKK